MRLFLLCALMLRTASVARADDPYELLARVRTTISARLPLLAECTLQVLYRNNKSAINLKRCRYLASGVEAETGQNQGWNLAQDDIPPFLIIMSDLVDPLDPVSIAAPAPGNGAAAGASSSEKSEGTLRLLGKEQVDGTECDVVELSQTSKQIGPLQSTVGLFTVTSMVRKYYIGHDGLFHRIIGNVTWPAGDDAPGGKGAPTAMPLQKAQYVLNIISYRKAITFASRPESQPPTRSVALKQDGNQWPPPTFAISQDGRLLAEGSQGGDIHLVDAGTSQEKAVMKGHPARVTALAFSPDATRLVSADSLAMAVWSVQTGKLLYTLHDQPGIIDFTFAPNGKSVLTIGSDGPVQLRDVATGRALHSFEKRNFRSYFTFSPDGAYLAALNAYDLMLWNTSTWQPIAIDGIHGPAGGRVVFSPDSAYLALGGYFRVLTIWEARSGKKLQELKGTPGSISAAWFSPDGRTITALDSDQRGDVSDNRTGLTTWDTTSWQVVSSLVLNGGNHVEQGGETFPGNTFVLSDRLGQLDDSKKSIKFWQFPILPAKH